MSDSRDLPPETGPELPPKPEVALALLQTALSVHVYLDPRGDDVFVPSWFKKQPQLVLQVGLNMAVPIPDLDVGADALSCTLSFNRRPEFCRIPWGAIYGLVGDDGRGMIWPDSVPPEVAAAAEGRATTKKSPSRRGKLRAVSGEEDTGEPAEATAAAAPAPGRASAPEKALPAKKGARPGRRAGTRSERTGEDASRVSAPSAAERGSSLGAESEETSPAETPRTSTARRQLPPYLRIVK